MIAAFIHADAVDPSATSAGTASVRHERSQRSLAATGEHKGIRALSAHLTSKISNSLMRVRWIMENWPRLRIEERFDCRVVTAHEFRQFFCLTVGVYDPQRARGLSCCDWRQVPGSLVANESWRDGKVTASSTLNNAELSG